MPRLEKPGTIHISSLMLFILLGKGGKNRRRGKNENETEKRELVFKEDGQGKNQPIGSIDALHSGIRLQSYLNA